MIFLFISVLLLHLNSLVSFVVFTLHYGLQTSAYSIVLLSHYQLLNSVSLPFFPTDSINQNWLALIHWIGWANFDQKMVLCACLKQKHRKPCLFTGKAVSVPFSAVDSFPFRHSSDRKVAPRAAFPLLHLIWEERFLPPKRKSWPQMLIFPLLICTFHVFVL